MMMTTMMPTMAMRTRMMMTMTMMRATMKRRLLCDVRPDVKTNRWNVEMPTTRSDQDEDETCQVLRASSTPTKS